MLSFALRICLLFALDFGLLGAIYFVLPDTAKLNSSAEISRRDSQGRIHPTSIRPGSRAYVPYRDIPKALRFSVIVLEDSRFFQHHGFDFFEIQKALEATHKTGVRLRGASTLSQQLIKNLYLSSERSFWRKFIEALITIKLESTVPKWRILELYFNSIDWGKNRIGVLKAADFYFGKAVKDLSIKECVFLAAIIPNPALFGFEPDERFVRLQMLKAIERLYRSKVISLEEYSRALSEPIEFYEEL